MTLTRFFGAFAAFMIILFSMGASARTMDEIKASGTIIIGTDGTLPPFQYFVGSQLTGFEVDLGNEIAKRLGVKAEWKALAFDSLLAGLQQNRWDLVIASFGITPERSKAVDFASTHYCTGAVLVTLDPKIGHVSDIKGRTVSAQTGSTYFEAVQKIQGVKTVRNFSSDSDARNALVAKRADIWVTDKFAAKDVVEKNPTLGLHLGEMLFQEKIATAVKKNNDSVLKAYNQALKSIVEDGSYAKLSTKWFNEDIGCK